MLCVMWLRYAIVRRLSLFCLMLMNFRLFNNKLDILYFYYILRYISSNFIIEQISWKCSNQFIYILSFIWRNPTINSPWLSSGRKFMGKCGKCQSICTIENSKNSIKRERNSGNKCLQYTVEYNQAISNKLRIYCPHSKAFIPVYWKSKF